MFVSNKRIHDHHKGNGNEKQPLKQEKKEKLDKKSIRTAMTPAGRNANLPMGADSYPYKNHLDFINVISIATLPFPAAIFMLN
jgi:hypothetical protein